MSFRICWGRAKVFYVLLYQWQFYFRFHFISGLEQLLLMMFNLKITRNSIQVYNMYLTDTFLSGFTISLLLMMFYGKLDEMSTAEVPKVHWSAILAGVAGLLQFINGLLLVQWMCGCYVLWTLISTYELINFKLIYWQKQLLNLWYFIYTYTTWTLNINLIASQVSIGNTVYPQWAYISD